jgi:coenzyme PQQ precursor peptide PqqA
MGLYHFARWLRRQDGRAAKTAWNRGFHRPERRLTSLGTRVSVIGTMARAIAGRNTMVWKTPVIVEIAVGMEINAYACADIA